MQLLSPYEVNISIAAMQRIFDAVIQNRTDAQLFYSYRFVLVQIDSALQIQHLNA